MPTGAWRRRPPLPPTPGTEHVVPIGEATPKQAREYRHARVAERADCEALVARNPNRNERALDE